MKNTLKVLVCFFLFPTFLLGQNNFTHDDTLRGSITRERVWWDLTYYELRVRVDPEKQFIDGSTTVFYKVVEPYQTMQIDLQPPLSISRVLQDGKPLKFAKDADVISTVETIANTEKDKKTKAAALDFLAATNDAKYLSLFKNNVADSSYSVAGSALQGLAALDPTNAYTLAKKYTNDAKGDLGQVVGDIIMSNGTESDFDFIADRFDKAPLSREKLTMVKTFCAYLEKVSNVSNVKKGIDIILKFRNAIPEQFRGFTEPAFKAGLDKLSKARGTEIADYITKGMK